MSEISLYNTLRKIPEVSDAEAKEAVADVASSREVATKTDIIELKAEMKADIKDMATKAEITEVKAEITEVKAEIAEVKAEIAKLKSDFIAEMAKLETRMTWKLIGIGVAIIGVIKYL